MTTGGSPQPDVSPCTLTQISDADARQDLLVDPEDVPAVEAVGAASAGQVADVGGLRVSR